MLRINETRKRSFLKAISFRVIEIAASTTILYFFADIAIEVAFSLAVMIEVICLLLHYLFERIFNKVQWGRHIIDD